MYYDKKALKENIYKRINKYPPRQEATFDFIYDCYINKANQELETKTRKGLKNAKQF